MIAAHQMGAWRGAYADAPERKGVKETGPERRERVWGGEGRRRMERKVSSDCGEGVGA